MTDRIFMADRETCLQFCVALDKIFEMPVAPHTGPNAVTDPEVEAMYTALWNQVDRESKYIGAPPFAPAWPAWTLRMSEVWVENTENPRHVVWFDPATTAAAMQSAAAASLTLEERILLTVALATWLPDIPSDWVEPD